MKTVDVAGMPVGDGHPPRVMGVLNMSVESNYAPSTWGDVDRAVAHAEAMAADGADIVDVGLQSSNPKNPWQAQEVEAERLDRALEVLERVDADVAWSIETRYADVADAALAGGFDMVNDVCGFADPDMPGVCEAHDVPVVKMASPPDIRSPGHLETIDDCFEALERGGFTDRTIIDPAFGGWYDEKTYEDNWEMFRRLREFRAFGRPILTATNREDFLGDIADRPETEDQLYVSLAAATMEVERGAHVIRTHDVPETVDVVQVAHFLGDERVVEEPSTTDGPRVVELTDVSNREVARNLHLRGDSEAPADEGTTLAFQVDGLDREARSSLATAGAEHGFVVAVGAIDPTEPGDGTFVAGTAAAFDRALADLADGPDGLAEFAGSVRRALGREL